MNKTNKTLAIFLILVLVFTLVGTTVVTATLENGIAPTRVLLIQEPNPHNISTSTMPNILTDMGVNYNITTAADAATLDFSTYNLIIVANDQRTTTLEDLTQIKTKLEDYVREGGFLLYGIACDLSDIDSPYSYTIPGDVICYFSATLTNTVADQNHPIVTGALTNKVPLTSDMLRGNFISHSWFRTPLPSGTTVILRNSSNSATLIEYPLGMGTIIASSITWEWGVERIAMGITNSYAYAEYVEDYLQYALTTARELPQSITVDPDTASIIIGETCSLTATVLPLDAAQSSVKWSSSNPSVATVSDIGVVTAIARGNAVITASTGGSLSATCVVTVLGKNTVTFNDWDGRVIDTQVITDGRDATAPAGPDTKEGYHFVLWDKDFTNIKADTTITAQYSPNTYTITYKANGGTGADVVADLAYNQTHTIAANAFIRTENTFAGWNTATNGSGRAYAVGAQITITSNMVLYAQWNANNPPSQNIPSGTITPDPIIEIKASANVAFSYVLPNSKTGNYAITEGKLPAGVSLRPYPNPSEPWFWEIYGITSIPEKYSFSIKDIKSGNIQKYTLEILEDLSNAVLIKDNILQEVESYSQAYNENRDAILYSVFENANFLALYINGERILDDPDWFFHEDGSTKITIRAQTVQTKSRPGNNTICAEFRTTGGNLQRSAAVINVKTKSTISKTEVPLAAPTRYDDVAIKDWFYDDVEYISERGLMVGTGPRTFSPHMSMSRAMLVTVLYRLEGKPEVNSEFGVRNSEFGDIVENAWYYNAVLWAANNGIVEGYSSKVFGLNDPVTREQTVAILYRYAEMKGLDVSAAADLAGYSDMDEISDWALDAMKWAVAVGIIKGRTTTTTVPWGTSTRAEVPAIFRRYSEGFLSGEGKD